MPYDLSIDFTVEATLPSGVELAFDGDIVVDAGKDGTYTVHAFSGTLLSIDGAKEREWADYCTSGECFDVLLAALAKTRFTDYVLDAIERERDEEIYGYDEGRD